MAINITQSISRQKNIPLDQDSVFESLTLAQEYVNKTNTLAYNGQIIAVKNGDVYDIYTINATTKTLNKIGASTTSDSSSSGSSTEDQSSSGDSSSSGTDTSSGGTSSGDSSSSDTSSDGSSTDTGSTDTGTGDSGTTTETDTFASQYRVITASDYTYVDTNPSNALTLTDDGTLTFASDVYTKGDIKFGVHNGKLAPMILFGETVKTIIFKPTRTISTIILGGCDTAIIVTLINLASKYYAASVIGSDGTATTTKLYQGNYSLSTATDEAVMSYTTGTDWIKLQRGTENNDVTVYRSTAKDGEWTQICQGFNGLSAEIVNRTGSAGGKAVFGIGAGFTGNDFTDAEDGKRQLAGEVYINV